MTKKSLIFAISTFFLAISSYGQENTNTCGTGTIPDVEYAKMVSNSKLFQQEFGSKVAATEVVPIHFTIVRDVTCSNDRYSIIPKLIKGTGNQDGILDLIKKYFPFDLSLAGIRYVIDSDLAYIPDVTQNQKLTKDSKLYNLNKGIKAVNIYIVNTPRSYAYLPGFNPCKNCNDNLIVLSEAKILGVNTFEKEIAHELGHYFGLLHTFDSTEDINAGTSREKVTRGPTKNCEDVSDRFCQTEADPGAVLCSLNYPSDCQNTTPCGNNLLDQDGLEYKPLKFNLMSYYYLTTRCNSSPQVAFSFVDEQKNLMLYNLNNHVSRIFLKNSFQNLGIINFHAGEIRKSKCDASLFINATPLKDVTVDIGSFGNKSCKTLPADCGHYVGQNDWASTGIQKILPFKDNDPTNGVTTADLLAIQKHILNLVPFTNAYQMIAADANNNGTITTGDIVLIRKLILGIKPNILTPSWRFLSQLHENEMSQTAPFADSNPFKNKYLLKQYLAVGGNSSYLDHVDIDYSNQNVAYDPINWSFRGIKMGDVDCSASALLKGGETPNESITTKNNFEPIPPNKTLVINVLRNKDIPIETYQMQLGYDASKVELLSVSQGDDATNSIENNFNIGDLGKIRTVWTSSNNNKLDSKLQYSLFKLRFKTLSEIQNPDDLLHLSKEDFYNVFYNTNMLATNTDLTFLATMEENSGGFKVQKIKSNTTVMAYPNPTNNEFYLNIPLSVSGNIQIQVMDIVGKMLKNINIEGSEGQNEILINDLNLSGTNMLHYNIQTTEGNYQGKVLISK